MNNSDRANLEAGQLTRCDLCKTGTDGEHIPIEIDHNTTGVMVAVDGTEMPLVEGY